MRYTIKRNGFLTFFLPQGGKVEFFYTGDGLLSEQTEVYINSLKREYPYFIEVTKDFFKVFIPWYANNLPKYPATHEDCMGQEYQSESHAYCVLSKNGNYNNGAFIGFPNAKDREKTVKQFGSLIKNAEPFKALY